MIKCRRCGKEGEQNCQLHHTIPKYMGGTDADGRKYLCLNCHTKLHCSLLSIILSCHPKEMKKYNKLCAWIYKWLSKENKIKCKKLVEEFTNDFIRNTNQCLS